MDNFHGQFFSHDFLLHSGYTLLVISESVSYVYFLKFENMVIWLFRFKDNFRFLDFKGVFFSLFFDFWKFRNWFWNQNGYIWGGQFSVFFQFAAYL